MDQFDFGSFLECTGKEIQAKLERAGFYRHPSGIGDRREEIVRDVLSDVLPPRFELRKGKIVDSQGKLSREFDVIISERADVVPPMLIAGRHVVPVETVYGVIEVKSSLTKEGYDSFTGAVTELDEMVRYYEPITNLSSELREKIEKGISVQDADFGRLWSGIIALDAPGGEVLSKWLETCADGLWFICVPDRELATIWGNSDGWVAIDYGTKSLPVLVWYIMGILTSSRRRFRLLPKMRKYLDHIINGITPATVKWSAATSASREEETSG